MILLAIETSCDETAVAVLKTRRGSTLSFDVLSHKIASQIDIHREFGGVFPNVAKREHAKMLPQLIAYALEEAGLLTERTNDKKLSLELKKKLASLLEREQETLQALTVIFEGIQKPKIGGIAVTAGPGLAPALWVGVNTATALSTVWNLPLYPINHMEGHIIVSLLRKVYSHYEVDEPKRPTVALLVSGGHTEFVRIAGKRGYTIIGSTRDDAVGEAFDKVARMLGLPYPGGPEIGRLAHIARKENRLPRKAFILPRPMLHSKDLHMSMSGLKTAVLHRIKDVGRELSDEEKSELALEFENAVTDVLIAKTRQAVYETNSTSLIVGGGVSANSHLRERLESLAKEENVTLYLPEKTLAGDNGIMIGATGLFHAKLKEKAAKKINVRSSWPLPEKN